jgi:short-subunit dehydrogenase
VTVLAGSRVWITGASSGIGAALVRELAGRGCAVAATARRAELLERLAADRPGAVVPLPADVTDRAQTLAAAARARDRLGGIDIAILNAGTWRQMDVRAGWDGGLFRDHIETNLMGTAHGIEAVLDDMRRRHRGTIVGVASVAGYRGLPGAEGYSASKAAEIALLESLRIDLRPLGIRVQTVCPGFVRTDLTGANRFPMPFMLEPADAARRIVRGIERGRAEIVFPLPMMVGMKLLRLVPVRAFAAAYTAALR